MIARTLRQLRSRENQFDRPSIAHLSRSATHLLPPHRQEHSEIPAASCSSPRPRMLHRSGPSRRSGRSRMSQMRHFRQNRARAFRFPRSAADAALCQSRHVALRRSKTARYSMTSSAVNSSFGGMVSPSVLAVFILMTNSNFLGCTTGRSAGFAPFRTRPA